MSRNILTSALFGLAAIVALSGCGEKRELSLEHDSETYTCTYEFNTFNNPGGETITIKPTSDKYHSKEFELYFEAFAGSLKKVEFRNGYLPLARAEELFDLCKTKGRDVE